jgi:HAD superfamily hydrolase (TIGR01450 family)
MTSVTRVPERLFSGYALDLDGTVYLGDELLPGARKTIAWLREGGCRVVFLTNKPLSTGGDYADKLTRLGVPTAGSDVVTSLDSLVLYLNRMHPDARILPVTEALAEQVLHDAGFPIVVDPAKADVVVVSFDRTFDYQKLTNAYLAVRAGAVIVATNPDPFCPTPQGGIPDCAAMLAAIEACTGSVAEAVVGKPSGHMADALLARMNVPAAEAATVGDRILTDVAMGQRHGMVGMLVLTGATSAEACLLSPVRPDYVVPSLADIIPRSFRKE